MHYSNPYWSARPPHPKRRKNGSWYCMLHPNTRLKYVHSSGVGRYRRYVKWAWCPECWTVPIWKMKKHPAKRTFKMSRTRAARNQDD